MNIIKYCTLAVTFVGCVVANPAMAALNISVLNTNLTVGGTGFIDVVVTGAGDLVQSHQLELLITPSLGVASSLQFRAPQLSSYATFGNYIYAGDSLNEFLGPAFPKNFLNPVASQVFQDFDSTNSTNDVSIGAGPFLLARVDIEHIVPFGTDPNTVLGDTFTVSVVNGGGFGTSFLDSGFTPVTVDSATSGIVTLSSAAVPEPSSMLLLISGISAMGVRQLRKRKLAMVDVQS